MASPGEVIDPNDVEIVGEAEVVNVQSAGGDDGAAAAPDIDIDSDIELLGEGEILGGMQSLASEDRSGRLPFWEQVRRRPDLVFRPIENAIQQREVGIDYFSGVPDAKFRAGFSRADSEQERELYLTQHVGEGNFRKDKYGAWVIEPAGLRRLGLLPASAPDVPGQEFPRAIDERGLSLSDIADLRGDLGPMAGAALAGMLTGGAGSVALMAQTMGFGAFIGKGIDELIDQTAGINLQTPEEVMRDTAGEAGLAMLAETVAGKVLAPIGRKVMGPNAVNFDDERRALVSKAQDIGMKPTIGQSVDAPLLSTSEAIVRRVLRLGEATDRMNIRAAQAELARIEQSILKMRRRDIEAAELSSDTAGEAVIAAARRERKKLAKEATNRYAMVDAAADGEPIIPTKTLRQRAQDILDEGLITTEATKMLQELATLPDMVTATRMQVLRNRLSTRIESGTLTPGIDSRDAARLSSAADETFDDAFDDAFEVISKQQALRLSSAADEAVDQADELLEGPDTRTIIRELRKADDWYKSEINKFKDKTISRMAKEPGVPGALEPEEIVSNLIRRGQASKVRRARKVIPDDEWALVQHEFAQDLTENFLSRDKNPFVMIMDGRGLLNTLDKYGRDTLNATLDKDHVDALYNLGEAAQLVANKGGDRGGLVAAHIAARPLRNITRIVGLNILGKFYNSKAGVKWLTEGIKAPNTRAGAMALSRATMLFAMLAEDETREESDE